MQSFGNDADNYARFFRAAVWYGRIDDAESIRQRDPTVATRDIYGAALTGDLKLMKAYLEDDRESASRKGGPLGWDAITYLCFSNYLRLMPELTDAFVAMAATLLDAGASTKSGFFDQQHSPQPEWESLLYGSAGVAFNAPLTKLLLDRGADPNDNEVPYHCGENYDNTTMRVLLDSGKMSPDSLSTMLLRKADWHDYDGLALVLKAGAAPNHFGTWDHTTLQHAIKRDNGIENIDLLLDAGSDPLLPNKKDGRNAVQMAAARGRKDIMESFQKRGVRIELYGVDQWLLGCCMGKIDRVSTGDKDEVTLLTEDGGTFLAVFAANGNVGGMDCLLKSGVSVDQLYEPGDAYFDIAPNSTALHAAAWRAAHESVAWLIDRGADVNRRDGKGRTALELAVKACVDSYWTSRRSPGSVEVLLSAGASTDIPNFPSGYGEVDVLIRRYRNG